MTKQTWVTRKRWVGNLKRNPWPPKCGYGNHRIYNKYKLDSMGNELY